MKQGKGRQETKGKEEMKARNRKEGRKETKEQKRHGRKEGNQGTKKTPKRKAERRREKGERFFLDPPPPSPPSLSLCTPHPPPSYGALEMAVYFSFMKCQVHHWLGEPGAQAQLEFTRCNSLFPREYLSLAAPAQLVCIHGETAPKPAAS